jgi:hypothetical protein
MELPPGGPARAETRLGGDRRICARHTCGAAGRSPRPICGVPGLRNGLSCGPRPGSTRSLRAAPMVSRRSSPCRAAARLWTCFRQDRCRLTRASCSSPARWRACWSAAGKWYEFVLVDTPPALVVSDVTPLLRRVDGVLVVASLGLTTPDATVQVRNQLHAAYPGVIGVVLYEDVNTAPAPAATESRWCSRSRRSGHCSGRGCRPGRSGSA